MNIDNLPPFAMVCAAVRTSADWETITMVKENGPIAEAAVQKLAEAVVQSALLVGCRVGATEL